MNSNNPKDEMYFYSVKEKEKIDNVMKQLKKKIDSLIQENLKLRKEIVKAIKIVKKDKKSLKNSSRKISDQSKTKE